MLLLQLVVAAVGTASSIRAPAAEVAPFPPMMWHSWGLFTWWVDGPSSIHLLPFLPFFWDMLL